VCCNCSSSAEEVEDWEDAEATGSLRAAMPARGSSKTPSQQTSVDDDGRHSYSRDSLLSMKHQPYQNETMLSELGNPRNMGLRYVTSPV
jgi:hypothetical protein